MKTVKKREIKELGGKCEGRGAKFEILVTARERDVFPLDFGVKNVKSGTCDGNVDW